MQNVQQVLSKSIKYLQQHNIDDVSSSARFLLAHVLDLEPSCLLLHPQELTNEEEKAFQILLDRRAKREPVAYITSVTDFCGLKLKVNPSVLIPRPETEQLVRLVTEYVNANKPKTLIDVGTGSGAIVLALANELDDAKIIATDVSEESLHLAKQNAKQLGLDQRIEFIQTDLINSLDSKFQLLDAILVANLPYVPTKRLAKLAPEVRDFEPHLALDGGPDGLDCYRKLFKQIDKLATKPQSIFCEIDETHGKLIQELARSHWPKAKVTIEKDLAGLDRFAIVNL